MQRGSNLFALLLSCLFFSVRSKMYGCLKEWEEGPWASFDPPVYPRGLSKEVSKTQHAEGAHHLYDVYAQPNSLPEVVLQRSNTNRGDPGRMRSLFHKLRQGKPITMVVLGGSISCGADTRRVEQQYTSLVFTWINATFPHANHTYVNRCRPATPSMVIGACLDTFLPHDQAADLVLLEFTVNDDNSVDQGGIRHLPVMENENRRGFERFLRKLLKHPSKPALLYFHVYQPWHNANSFWLGPERELEIILQYYSIPTISARNALFLLGQYQAAGFSEDAAHCMVHPNPLGHRYYGDLVIASLQDHAYAALAVPEEHMQYPHVFEGLMALPPPMLEENWDFDSECMTGELLRQVVVSELSEGWEFVDEGKPGGRPKLGFRTLLPDTELVFEINTKAHDIHVDGDVMLAVGYLLSYEHMGLFSIQCVSGCKCDGVYNISGTHNVHSSILMLKYFSASQHEQCRLKVTSMHDPETGGDKTRIDMLMVASGISGSPGLLTWLNMGWTVGKLLLGGH